METNIAGAEMDAYAQSYLWVKNWWLVNGVVPDTSKGGNTFSPGSKLSKPVIDSLSKVFNKYLPGDIVREGDLVPRINFSVGFTLRVLLQDFCRVNYIIDHFSSTFIMFYTRLAV